MDKFVDSFQNRLNYALTVKNIRPIDLSEKSGISKSKISHYMSGRSEPKADGLNKIAKALNVSPVWLLGYNVPMVEILNATNDVPTKIAVVGKISAGLPILANENIEGYEFAPSTFIKKDFEYFYLKVQGDSMNLKFNDGNLILIQKQQFLDNGEIGVFLIDGIDATVKKYRLENNIVVLEPMSTNAEHHVQLYDVKKVQIIGKVILSIGKV